ncbi:Na+/H+ antiporter NhaC [Suttonella sp. R2A3]|uniref:Na+/H+ antiporter NhaC n=1 Tax=Suttonella sp. R2A3 TaxID=2908648 RepID=UPI001F405BFF|nr:Na+/H+ antiporter NhaC [Suttonella sp. R2A3]UJF25265.1 Na+/H+ antiporter NhaC [Suttonella sp. R2A3]
MEKTASEKKRPSIGLSLVPIVFLIVMMTINVIVFSDDATYGPNQFALIFAAVLAGVLGVWRLGVRYKDIENSAIESIGMSMQAMLILLVVGALIASWIMSGVVPLLILYGLKVISPSIFLFTACVLSAVVSLCTGSSWSTAGTVGVALIAIADTLNIPLGMAAGAVVSGAYFGDKMSPLSETTNLAPAMVGTDLFTHIRHMVYTSGPAMIIALLLFLLIGFFYQGDTLDAGQIDDVIAIIGEHFNTSPLLLIVPIATIALVARRFPALPSLIFGVLLGVLFTLIFQQDLLQELAGPKGIGGMYALVISTLANGFSIETGNQVIDDLFSRGGMFGMMNTIWLIFCAMVFGGSLEATGMLQRLADAILSMVRGTGSLIGATVATCLFTNITASDQYIAIVIPARMFKTAYAKAKLLPKNLSRAVEDSGTVTSVLVPWNTCGAFFSGVLGVQTMAYAPFAFFNLLSPIISVFLGAMNWTIERVKEENGYHIKTAESTTV